MSAFHWRCARVVAAALSLSLLCGCACTNRDNHFVLKNMDEAVKLKSVTARCLLAPVIIPTGTAAFAIDAVVTIPIMAVPKAWDDVYELYWKPREVSAMRKTLMFLPIVALTPVTFAGDWALRCIFDVGDPL